MQVRCGKSSVEQFNMSPTLKMDVSPSFSPKQPHPRMEWSSKLSNGKETLCFPLVLPHSFEFFLQPKSTCHRAESLNVQMGNSRSLDSTPKPRLAVSDVLWIWRPAAPGSRGGYTALGVCCWICVSLIGHNDKKWKDQYRFMIDAQRGRSDDSCGF